MHNRKLTQGLVVREGTYCAVVFGTVSPKVFGRKFPPNDESTASAHHDSATVEEAVGMIEWQDGVHDVPLGHLGSIYEVY